MIRDNAKNQDRSLAHAVKKLEFVVVVATVLPALHLACAYLDVIVFTPNGTWKLMPGTNSYRKM
jgi:hypothetical protein